MSVVVGLEDAGPCRKQLTVEVPAPAVEAEEQRVIHELGTRLKFPGFRKGKVPARLVRQRYAKDIEREVIERLLPRYWRQAEAESAIEPLLPPEIGEVRERQPGEPLTFVATVETRPRIELRNLRDFALPDPAIEPGEMEIDDALGDLRRRLGKWVPVERPAARGDLVKAEVTSLGGAHGEAAAPKTDNLSIEVGAPEVWEELTLAVSGLAAGQETTFTRRHEHPPEQEGGAPLVHEQSFRVRLHQVEERELPPLDDDFARRILPQAGTVAQLREAVTSELRRGKVDQRYEQRQRALLDQLRERHPLELPQGVVRKEVESLVQDYAESLARQGVDLERTKIDWDRMAGDMVPLAERRVHARLLLDAIAEAEGIRVSEEEFERTLAMLAKAQNTSTPALRRSLDESGKLPGLRQQLQRDKTIRSLLGEEPAADAAAVPELTEA